MKKLPDIGGECEAFNQAVERWLRREVIPAYDGLKENPSRAVTLKQVRARLAAEHKKTSARH